MSSSVGGLWLSALQFLALEHLVEPLDQSLVSVVLNLFRQIDYFGI